MIQLAEGVPVAESSGEIVLYRTDDGRSEIQLRAADGTVWLTQAQMAELFATTIQNVNQRILAILADGELTEATINSELIVRQEGERMVRREIQVYNLDMILAVGYRVRSPRGVQFRQWATTVLSEFLVKGFVLDDRRLKEPGGFDYFDELLERIRDIRASEKRFYQKVRDLFATTSADYDADSELKRKFFATIQNKLVYAVTGHTCAELIVKRCDPNQPNMGLTSWEAAKVRKKDVTVAKNYLTSDEIDDLNRLTTQFLDFAEGRAKKRQQITMAEWVVQADRFIEFNELGLLKSAGRVSHSEMEAIARERFSEFDASRRELEAARAAQEDHEEMLRLEAEARELQIAELEQVEDDLLGRRGPEAQPS
ncbi:virulence RhuM family protein [Nonomuraea dietziae]|uniref:virulence RhuM family protein n=1 Tax=Nonomuraea dietziae TaxID=65515 RepID=UPI003414DCF2